MGATRATAVASPNIALIKYWGHRDPTLRLPANGSISMTLSGLETRVRVAFDPTLPEDEVLIGGKTAEPGASARVSQQLEIIRGLASIHERARVESSSNFPSAAGLASSASAFAALSLAGAAAAGLHLDPAGLSRLARRGSGSACRSIFGGFVEWQAGETDESSSAQAIAPPGHWALIDLIAIVSREQKAVPSSTGHLLAFTSPLQAARLADTPRRLDICRQAILTRDFGQLALIVEQDSYMMHAVMMTSTPPILYWTPTTLHVLRAVSTWREEGLPVCATLDAGPNVHCLTPAANASRVHERLQRLAGVLEVLTAGPGGPARILESDT
jgi:diphosphomevalonate decarboxylase